MTDRSSRPRGVRHEHALFVFAATADDLVVIGVLLVVGSICLVTGLVESAESTSGAIGLVMLTFAVWSLLHDVVRLRSPPDASRSVPMRR